MRVNPVIEKDLKTKMRGWRAPALLTIYLVVLGLVVFFGFLDNITSSRYTMASFNPRTAYNVYNTLAGFQLFLLMFIVPATTAGTVSGERERQTLDLMLCTNLSPFSIIIGKVAVSIAQIMLLIAASLPVLGTVFLFGGIGMTDLLLLFAFYLTTALMLASIGIFFSTFFRKSSVATILSYTTLLALTFGTVAAFSLYTRLTMNPVQYQAPTMARAMVFMFGNPLFGFGDLIGDARGGISILGVFTSSIGNIAAGKKPFIISPWMMNMIFNVFLTAVLIPISTWRLKRNR